jgi:hypothetical protein
MFVGRTSPHHNHHKQTVVSVLELVVSAAAVEQREMAEGFDAPGIDVPEDHQMS